MAIRITYRASVSFEYDSSAPQTYRSEIVAANGAQALRRAYTGARKTFQNARPQSVVAVLDEISRGTVAVPQKPKRKAS